MMVLWTCKIIRSVFDIQYIYHTTYKIFSHPPLQCMHDIKMYYINMTMWHDIDKRK